MFFAFIVNGFVLVGGIVDEAMIGRFLFLSLILGVFSLILLKQKNKTNLKIDLWDLSLLLLYLFSLSSFFWCINRTESLIETQKIPLFIGTYVISLYFLSGYKETGIKHICRSAMIISIGTCLITQVQIINVIKTVGLDRNTIYMIGGFSAHKNLLSGFLMLLLPFQFIGIKMDNLKLRMAYKTSALLLLILIAVLQSRAVIIGIVSAITLYYFIIYTFKKGKIFLIKLLFWGFLSSAFLFFISFILFGYIPSEILSSFTSIIGKGSGIERLMLWQKSSQLFINHWLLGVGAGNWKIAMPLVGIEGLYRAESATFSFIRPHNDWIWILTELGIIGFGIVIVFFANLIKKGMGNILKSIDENELKTNVILLVSLFSYLIYSQFDFPRERIEHTTCLALIAGLISYKSTKWKLFFLIKKSIFNTVLLIFAGVFFFNVYMGYFRVKGERYAKEIFEAEKQRNWETVKKLSISAENKFFNMNPVGSPISLYAGVASIYANDFESAEIYLKKAIEINPGFFRSYNNLGAVYFNQGKLELAKENFEKTLKISPNNDDANYNMAHYYFQKENFIECEKSLLRLDEKEDRRKGMLLVCREKMNNK